MFPRSPIRFGQVGPIPCASGEGATNANLRIIGPGPTTIGLSRGQASALPPPMSMRTGAQATEAQNQSLALAAKQLRLLPLYQTSVASLLVPPPVQVSDVIAANALVGQLRAALLPVQANHLAALAAQAQTIPNVSPQAPSNVPSSLATCSSPYGACSVLARSPNIGNFTLEPIARLPNGTVVQILEERPETVPSGFRFTRVAYAPDGRQGWMFSQDLS